MGDSKKKEGAQLQKKKVKNCPRCEDRHVQHGTFTQNEDYAGREGSKNKKRSDRFAYCFHEKKQNRRKQRAST